MLNLDVIFLEFIDNLYRTDDPSLMFKALERSVHDLGFDYLSYTFMPSIVLSDKTNFFPVFQLSEGYDTGFIKHYSEADFAQKDYTVQGILDLDMTVKNWWGDVDSKKLNTDQQLVLNVARHDYGMVNGVTVPTYGDGYSVGGVSVSSMDSSHYFSIELDQRLEILRKMSIMYSDRIIGLSSTRSFFEAPFLDLLSSTEKRVLSLMAKGLNIQSIAHELKLDYKYLANKIVANIRKKMGGVSRDRMMYLAGEMTIERASKD